MMKTKHFIPLTLLSALATLGACISPQDEPGDCQDCGLQQIALQVQENGGATTRAGRPLYSSQQQQMVDHVALYICYYGNKDGEGNPISGKEDNTIAAVKHLDNWMAESDRYDNGQRYYLSLMGDNRVPEDATYKIYAIGYTYREDESNTTEYTAKGESNSDVNLETYLKGLKEGDKFPENLVLNLSDDKPGEEIFAGTHISDAANSDGLIHTNDAGGFVTTVLLHRQVAGIYMYVTDIPKMDQAKELRLTAACDNDGLVLGHFDSEDYENGKGKGDYVVNGTNAQDGIGNDNRATLCTINLEDWKGENDAWKNAYDADNTNPVFEEGSYFAGCFVIPFAAPDATETDVRSLQLELYGDNDKELQTWPVKLPEGDPQVKGFTRYTWDATNNKFTSTDNVTETQDAFSLLRNHLYCIGSKDADNDTNGDEPQSLSDDTPIILEVIAEWDHIYDMELEPEPGGGTTL